jgi:hypothetical protein
MTDKGEDVWCRPYAPKGAKRNDDDDDERMTRDSLNYLCPTRKTELFNVRHTRLYFFY